VGILNKGGTFHQNMGNMRGFSLNMGENMGNMGIISTLGSLSETDGDTDRGQSIGPTSRVGGSKK
jgi:hypothetical protein